MAAIMIALAIPILLISRSLFKKTERVAFRALLILVMILSGLWVVFWSPFFCGGLLEAAAS